MKAVIRKYDPSDMNSCQKLWAELTQRHRDIYMEYVMYEAGNLQIRFLSVKPVVRNIEAISFFVEAGFTITGHIDLFQDLLADSKREWKTGLTLHGNELNY